MDARLPKHRIEQAIKKLKNSPDEKGEIKEFVIQNRDLTISLSKLDGSQRWYPLQSYNSEICLLVSSPEIKKKIPGKSITVFSYTSCTLGFMSKVGMDGRTLRGKYNLYDLCSGYRASLMLENKYDDNYISAINLGNALSEKPHTTTRIPGHWYLRYTGESFVYLDKVENAICGGYPGIWGRNNELYGADGETDLFSGDQLKISGDVTISLNCYSVAVEELLGNYYKKPMKEFLQIQNNTKYFPSVYINPKSRLRCIDMGEYFTLDDTESFKSIYSSLITSDFKTRACRSAALLFPKDSRIDKKVYKNILLKNLKEEISKWRSAKTGTTDDSIDAFKGRTFDNFTYKCLLHNLILELPEDEVEGYIKKFW